MKRMIIATAVFMFLPGVAAAVPALQLDCDPCVYVGGDEESNVVTEDPVFEVAVMATPGGSQGEGGTLSSAEIESDTFFLSIALMGVDEDTDLTTLGPLLVNGVEVDWSEFVWGTPPATATANPELGGHGVYDTWYLELAFTFPTDPNCGTYNTQTDASYVSEGSSSYCVTWDIDMSGLSPDVELHFDAYNTTTNSREQTIRGTFAPYSKDVSTDVPEPGTLALLGMGLLTLGLSRRRRQARVVSE